MEKHLNFTLLNFIIFTTQPNTNPNIDVSSKTHQISSEYCHCLLLDGTATKSYVRQLIASLVSVHHRGGLPNPK